MRKEPGLFAKQCNGHAAIRALARVAVLLLEYFLIRFICLFYFFCCVSAFAQPLRFLTITDIHYGSDNVALDGHDTGDEFLAVVMKQFNKLSHQVDFIINLGDLPTHLFFVTPKKEEYETFLFRRLFANDSAAKPMFYVTGNNDSLAGNYQPFAFEGRSPLSCAVDWTGACAYCDGLLIDDSHMRDKGYYSSYVAADNKEVILIALNSTPFADMPFYVPTYPNQEHDARQQLAWLEQQLKQHKAKQLLIAMHIPPGSNYKGGLLWREDYSQRLIQLLDNYSASYGEITLLTAHTHMDELRKIYLQSNKSIFAYSTPGISRLHHNNPGMKLFSLDEEAAIANYTTYYTSQLADWTDEHYHALGGPNAIFSYCRHNTLAACLGSLSDEQVCRALEEGLFYGVKSDRVFNNVCKITYPINYG